MPGFIFKLRELLVNVASDADKSLVRFVTLREDKKDGIEQKSKEKNIG